MNKKTIIGFYDENDENGYMSNWYRAGFNLDGRHFFCNEQYMMYRKAEVFGDEETMARIMASDDQGEIKNLGRSVKNFNKSVWAGMRQVVVFRGLLAKFIQNPDLGEMLLATGDAILAECSPKDDIWGIKLDITDERCRNTYQWQGKNLLGYALMEVREQLKQ